MSWHKVVVGSSLVLLLGCGGAGGSGASGPNDAGSASSGGPTDAAKPLPEDSGGGTPSSVGAASGSKAICSADDWCWRNPWPQGNKLNDIAGDGDALWVVGARGTIMQRDGDGWSGVDAGTDVDLEGVWVSGETVVAVGHGALVERAGGSWKKVDVGGAKLEAVWGSGDAAFAVGRKGALWQKKGGTWSKGKSGVENHLNALWGTGPSDVYAVGEEVVLHYDGSAWSKKPAPKTEQLQRVTFLGVWGSGPSDVYAVGWHRKTGRLVMHYDGKAWAEQKTEVEKMRTLYDVWSSGSDAFIVGTRVALKGGGGSWASLGLPAIDLFGVWGKSATDVIAVGARGQIYAFDGSVKAVSRGATATLEAAAVDGSGTVWAVGEKGIVLKGGDDGYAKVDAGTTARLRGVASKGDAVVIVGEAGTVVEGSGDSLKAGRAGVSDNLHAVAFVGDTPVAVGAKGAVLRKVDGSWKRLKNASQEDLEAIWSAGDVAFAVGKRGTVLKITDAVEPLRSGSDDHLFGVSGNSATDMVVVGRDGAVLVYDGSGFKALPKVKDPLGRDAWLTGVAAAGSTYAITGGNGTIATLSGGKVTPQRSGVADMLRAAVAIDGAWVVVGDHGAVLHHTR